MVEQTLRELECTLLRGDVEVESTGEAVFVLARLADPSAHDLAFDRAALSRRLEALPTIDAELASTGPCPTEDELVDAETRVTIRLELEIAHIASTATDVVVQARRAVLVNGCGTSEATRVRWRRSEPQLRLIEHRAWPVIAPDCGGNTVIRFSAETWRELDRWVDRSRDEGPVACHIAALELSRRPRDVLAVIDALPPEERARYRHSYLTASWRLGDIARAEAFHDWTREQLGDSASEIASAGIRSQAQCELAPVVGHRGLLESTTASARSPARRDPRRRPRAARRGGPSPSGRSPRGRSRGQRGRSRTARGRKPEHLVGQSFMAGG